MRACPQPIIAGSNGVCAGAVPPSPWPATFASVRRRQGRIPVQSVGLAGCDMGCCAMLPRIILAKAAPLKLLYTGRPSAGRKPERWVSSNRLGRQRRLVTRRAGTLPRNSRAGPTFGNAMTKRISK